MHARRPPCNSGRTERGVPADCPLRISGPPAIAHSLGAAARSIPSSRDQASASIELAIAVDLAAGGYRCSHRGFRGRYQLRSKLGSRASAAARLRTLPRREKASPCCHLRRPSDCPRCPTPGPPGRARAPRALSSPSLLGEQAVHDHAVRSRVHASFCVWGTAPALAHPQESGASESSSAAPTSGSSTGPRWGSLISERSATSRPRGARGNAGFFTARIPAARTNSVMRWCAASTPGDRTVHRLTVG